VKTEDYIRMDTLELNLYATKNPLHLEDGLQKILEVVNTYASNLIPDRVSLGKSSAKYSIEAVQRLLSTRRSSTHVVWNLNRTSNPEVLYSFDCMNEESSLGLWLWMVVPFSYFEEPEQSQERSREFTSFISALSKVCRPIYGYAHSRADISLGTDPHQENPFAPKQVYQAYWMNIYGSSMVENLGRERVFSTPAALIEELPDGGALILTTPKPVDYASDQSRLAQAHLLAHLRDDVNLDEVILRLRERSAILRPVERNWDSDIEDLLELTLDDVRYAERQQQTAKLNNYRPPEVSEWRPLEELLQPDVEDVEATIDLYGGLYAEQLVALLHKEIPQVMQFGAESLALIDYHFWHFNYAEEFRREDIETDLVPAIGAYLGEVMIRHLGGCWVPQRNLDEAQVVVGNRVWLPILRARHYMQSTQSALDYSLTKFYRTAART
jgi:hypothetical protein